MEQIKNTVLTVSAILLALLMLAALVRVVLGPRYTDRIVGVNVVNSLVVAELAVLSVRMGEDFLLDVALIYALLSFLTVVVVARMMRAREWKTKETKGGGHDAP